MTESVLRVAIVIAVTQALVLMFTGGTSWSAVVGSALSATAVEIYYRTRKGDRR